ncbi:MAG: CDGSH iron-sulfur domain-containing protein [Nitrospinota bacterium]|nr:CDGSH iron-sulfur domain-containing protein [Nitrospinota bacterium]
MIMQNAPYIVEVEEGKTYRWCACGHSKAQPYCDGTHKSTAMTPLSFTADKTGPKALCGCRKSGRKPFCDGTHNL